MIDRRRRDHLRQHIISRFPPAAFVSFSDYTAHNIKGDTSYNSRYG